MKTFLHIHKDCFTYNGLDQEADIRAKLEAFVTDIRDIVYDAHTNDTQFVVPVDILSWEIFEKMSFQKAISSYLDSDQSGIFYAMMGNMSETENLTLDTLREQCRYKAEEESIHSLLSFNIEKQEQINNPYIQFDEYEIVYNKSTWDTLRRQILGNHPGTPSEFVKTSRVLFKNVEFHDECVNTLEDNEYKYLSIVPRKLVYYISCLNDCFYNHLSTYGNKRNENTLLADFSGKYGLDEAGSLQGNSKKKDLLRRTFKNAENNDIQVLCEPHLKIASPDNNYQGKSVGRNFHPRIYFHYQRPEFPNKVLVGAMGEHLA